MRVVSSLLASLFAVLTFSASSAGPLPKSIPPDKWVTIAQGPDMMYDVLAGSIEADKETFSIQFIMRVVLKEPMIRNGKEVQMFAERSLILCRENVFVTMSQVFYNSKNEQVDVNSVAEVYKNPNQNGQIVTELMRFACGFSPADNAPKPKEPEYI